MQAGESFEGDMVRGVWKKQTGERERIEGDFLREVWEKQAGERVVDMLKKTLGVRRGVMKRRKTLWKVGYRNASP